MSPMDDQKPSVPRDHIEALEAHAAYLQREIEGLRAAIRKLRGAPESSDGSAGSAEGAAPATRPATDPASTPMPRTARPRRAPLDLEKLVGRYGTIAVATLAILLGVGAFLQWAIARGLLGPEVRVALGALAALVLAAIGMRLRRQGSARFGNVLLAIALAVVHLVAWAAGPNLHLVSSTVALILAAAASTTLAALAIADGEQALFAVGVGGALLAPFVTTDGTGEVRSLLAFGWIVSTAAVAALREPNWVIARRLIIAFAALYVGSALGTFGFASTPDELRLPTLFAAAVAVSALVLAEPTGRRALTRSLLILMAFSLLIGGQRSASEWDSVVFAFIGTLAVHAMRRRGEVTPGGGEDSAFDAVILPLGFLLAGIAALDDPTSRDGALVAGTWAALAGALLAFSPVVQRGWHLTVVFTALQLALMLGVRDFPVALVLASAALACAVTVSYARMREGALQLPLGLALLAATLGSWELLAGRPAYLYTPLLTTASLAALGTVVAWTLFSRVMPAALFGEDSTKSTWRDRPEVALTRASGVIAFFLWGREEFARAFSADVATFLLITYYAVAGVATIGIGRARGISGMRQVGLVLSLYAALKAVVQASDLSHVGLKVASYLVVGVFLLGVGYWYRATPAPPPSDATSRSPAS